MIAEIHENLFDVMKKKKLNRKCTTPEYFILGPQGWLVTMSSSNSFFLKKWKVTYSLTQEIRQELLQRIGLKGFEQLQDLLFVLDPDMISRASRDILLSKCLQ
jgi:hypothetical protein